MQVVVETSFDFSKVTKVKGEPKFYFFEVSRVFATQTASWGATSMDQAERAHFWSSRVAKDCCARATSPPLASEL